MEAVVSKIKRFMTLFDGYEKAHGQYRVTNKGDDGKLSGRAITNSDPATEENYREHLKVVHIYLASSC